MALLEVNKETCTKCGVCAAICPGGIILFFDDKYPRPISRADEFCLRCGHCVGVCPTGSLSHQDIPVEQCPSIEDSLKISLDQCAQLIRSRRSIRKYQDKSVPREEIVRLVDIARYAPTGHNAQEVQWLVIDDKEKLLRFEEIGLDWMRDTINKNPQMAEMFEGLRQSIWSEELAASNVNSFRRSLQRAHLDRLAQLVVNPTEGVPEDAATLARADLVALNKAIGSAVSSSSLDAYTRAHLDETRARIEAVLKASVERRLGSIR